MVFKLINVDHCFLIFWAIRCIFPVELDLELLKINSSKVICECFEWNADHAFAIAYITH